MTILPMVIDTSKHGIGDDGIRGYVVTLRDRTPEHVYAEHVIFAGSFVILDGVKAAQDAQTTVRLEEQINWNYSEKKEDYVFACKEDRYTTPCTGTYFGDMPRIMLREGEVNNVRAYADDEKLPDWVYHDYEYAVELANKAQEEYNDGVARSNWYERAKFLKSAHQKLWRTVYDAIPSIAHFFAFRWRWYSRSNWIYKHMEKEPKDISGYEAQFDAAVEELSIKVTPPRENGDA